MSPLPTPSLSHRNLVRRALGLALTVGSAWSGLSCGAADIAGPPVPASVASIVVSPTSASLVAGASTTLSAMAKDGNGAPLADRVITWSTSASSVASVTQNGVVTGVTAGTATITAASEGRTATSLITVTSAIVPVASVVVSPASASIEIGSSVTIIARAADAGGNTLADRVVTWSSSSGSVATVNATGVVTGIAVGTATITATSETKTTTAIVTVTAIPVPVASVTLSPASAALLAGATVPLVATTKDAAGNALSGRAIAFSSSDATVAAVTATGVVTGLSAGTATITATSETRTATAIVTVTVPAVASVLLNPATAAIAVGASTTLKALAVDANGNTLNDRYVLWSTSDGAVATVNVNGVVTGIGAGTVTITATSEGKTATAIITVSGSGPVSTGPAVYDVLITPATASVAVGATTTLVATPRSISQNLLTGRLVTFSSSDVTKATVSATGVVTGIAAGAVTITATSETRTGTATVVITGPVQPAVTVTGPVFTMENATCAITTANAAYCWGFGANGETGNPVGGSNVPVPVQGGLTFAAVSSHGSNTCGLTLVGDAYCWGNSSRGALGDGNAYSGLHFAPVAVVGGLRFTTITSGTSFSCGLIADGTAYCWGAGSQGQLAQGPSDLRDHASPTPVPNLRFQSIRASDYVACGITLTGAAYCWGWTSGIAGSGGYALTVTPTPVAVPGVATLRSVTVVNAGQACGLDATGHDWCWGAKIDFSTGTITVVGETSSAGGLVYTQLVGSGSQICGITAAGATYCRNDAFVAPSLMFQGIVVGTIATRGPATCVIATTGQAYCQGNNFLGVLGDGTNTSRSTPTPVVGGLTFRTQ